MKCNQLSCGQEASYLYTWPGKDEAGICTMHMPMLKNVAAAIGLHLQIKPIPIPTVWGNMIPEPEIGGES